MARKTKTPTAEELEEARQQQLASLAAQQQRDEFLRELGRMRQELMDDSLRTLQRWHSFRTGRMRELVVEMLRAAPSPEDLRQEDGWCPIGGPEYGLPRSWNRWVEGETVERWRDTGDLTRPFAVKCVEQMQEVLVPICDYEVSGRRVVCVHPPTWYDYVIAFGHEGCHDYRNFDRGRWAHTYDGPGGVMITRPFVYHGPEGGYSMGEFYCGALPTKEAA